LDGVTISRTGLTEVVLTLTGQPARIEFTKAHSIHREGEIGCGCAITGRSKDTFRAIAILRDHR
jgi:hypothetical protein